MRPVGRIPGKSRAVAWSYFGHKTYLDPWYSDINTMNLQHFSWIFRIWQRCYRVIWSKWRLYRFIWKFNEKLVKTVFFWSWNINWGCRNSHPGWILAHLGYEQVDKMMIFQANIFSVLSRFSLCKKKSLNINIEVRSSYLEKYRFLSIFW